MLQKVLDEGDWGAVRLLLNNMTSEVGLQRHRFTDTEAQTLNKLARLARAAENVTKK
jgi:hypothetical protein